MRARLLFFPFLMIIAIEIDPLLKSYRNMQESAFAEESVSPSTSSTALNIQLASQQQSCLWGMPDKKTPTDMAGCGAVEGVRLDTSTPMTAFVITLMGTKHREANANCITSSLGKHKNADVVRVHAQMAPAVSKGHGLDILALREKNQLTDRGELKDGEIGVYMSHINAWNFVKIHNLPVAIVFEDDAQIAENFEEQLTGAMKDLPADWDIMWLFDSPSVKLNGNLNRPSSPVSCKQNVRKKGHGIGLDGYVISLGGATKLLEMALPINKRPIDLVLHQLIQDTKINAFLSNPPLVYDDFAMMSEIQQRHYSELKGIVQKVPKQFSKPDLMPETVPDKSTSPVSSKEVGISPPVGVKPTKSKPRTAQSTVREVLKAHQKQQRKASVQPGAKAHQQAIVARKTALKPKQAPQTLPPPSEFQGPTAAAAVEQKVDVDTQADATAIPAPTLSDFVEPKTLRIGAKAVVIEHEKTLHLTQY